MKKLDHKKCTIEVFTNTSLKEVLKTFTTISELENWIENDKPFYLDIEADQVAINDCVLMGWDELYDFI